MFLRSINTNWCSDCYNPVLGYYTSYSLLAAAFDIEVSDGLVGKELNSQSTDQVDSWHNCHCHTPKMAFSKPCHHPMSELVVGHCAQSLTTWMLICQSVTSSVSNSERLLNVRAVANFYWPICEPTNSLIYIHLDIWYICSLNSVIWLCFHNLAQGSVFTAFRNRY